MEVRSPMVDVKALAGCLPAVSYWGCSSHFTFSRLLLGYPAMCIENCPPSTRGGAARPLLVIGGALDWTSRLNTTSRSITHMPFLLVLSIDFLLSLS